LVLGDGATRPGYDIFEELAHGRSSKPSQIIEMNIDEEHKAEAEAAIGDPTLSLGEAVVATLRIIFS